MRDIKVKGKVIYTIGRPITYTHDKKIEILEKLVKYIEKEDYPTIPEFCVQNNIYKQRIYEWAKEESINKDCEDKPSLAEYFTDCIKRINEKQEAYMENAGMNNKIPIAFAIFKLKNLGWKDRIAEEINVNDDLVNEIRERNKAIIEAINNSDL